jgi:tryptophan synthase alpha chain
LDLIRLISPTTPKKTIEKIVKFSSGFLYYVSFRGVTGAKLSNFKEVQDNVKYIKSKTKLPVVVGFGIKEGEIAQKMSKISDGVVIGSRLIDIVQQNNFRLNDSLNFLEKSLRKFRRDVRKK